MESTAAAKSDCCPFAGRETSNDDCDIDSVPPASTAFASPARIALTAINADCIPEPHIMLTVNAVVLKDSPIRIAT